MRQQPRQGRDKVAQGASPGWHGPLPAFGTPLPPERERGWGEGRPDEPTAYAVGYPLTPASRASRRKQLRPENETSLLDL